jgi:hypothetical protein
MPRYEYKVVPAPQRGLKGKGIRRPEGRFSNALETLMNAMGENGWDYQRAETLPSLERSGLTSTTTEWRNVLVFRRLRETAAEAFAPELLPPPDTAARDTAHSPQIEVETEARMTPVEAEKCAHDLDGIGASADLKIPPKVPDNGVEVIDDDAGIGTSVEKLAAYRKSLTSDG